MAGIFPSRQFNVELARLALEATKQWVAQPEIRQNIRTYIEQMNLAHAGRFAEWEDGAVSYGWREQSRRLGALFNEEFIAEIAVTWEAGTRVVRRRVEALNPQMHRPRPLPVRIR